MHFLCVVRRYDALFALQSATAVVYSSHVAESVFINHSVECISVCWCFCQVSSRKRELGYASSRYPKGGADLCADPRPHVLLHAECISSSTQKIMSV